jgi:hypothetical protein
MPLWASRVEARVEAAEPEFVTAWKWIVRLIPVDQAERRSDA